MTSVVLYEPNNRVRLYENVKVTQIAEGQVTFFVSDKSSLEIATDYETHKESRRDQDFCEGIITTTLPFRVFTDKP